MKGYVVMTFKMSNKEPDHVALGGDDVITAVHGNFPGASDVLFLVCRSASDLLCKRRRQSLGFNKYLKHFPVFA